MVELTFLTSSGVATSKKGGEGPFAFGHRENICSLPWLGVGRSNDAPVKMVSLGIFHIGLVKLLLKMPSRQRLYILPLGQLDPYSLKHDIFSSDPSVRALESKFEVLPPNKQSTSKLGQKIKDKLRSWFSKVSKKLFLLSLGSVAKSRKISLCLIPMSENEARNVARFARRVLKADVADPVSFPFNVDEERVRKSAVSVSKSRHQWLRDSTQNHCEHIDLIYFGRLAIEQKGLDLLLEMTHFLCHMAGLQVVTKLVGPGDRLSVIELKNMVDSLGITKQVELLLPGDYEPGSLAPLAHSDFSVLLSRWDGFSRTCQESLSVGTPVICSEESNFGDVVREYGCGLVVPRGEPKTASFERVASFLHSVDRKEMSRRARAASTAYSGARSALGLHDRMHSLR